MNMQQVVEVPVPRRRRIFCGGEVVRSSHTRRFPSHAARGLGQALLRMLLGIFIFVNVAAVNAAPDLTNLLTQLQNAPEGTWIRANLNNFSDVWAPEELQPFRYAGGTGALIIAWSSFAWDSNRGDLIIFGGGHANYAGNEIYRWHGGTQLWERASVPSDVVQIGPAMYEAIDGAMNAPVSSHTYDNQLFLPTLDRFLTFGGAAFDTGGPFRMKLADGSVRMTGPYLWNPALGDANEVGGTTGSHVKRIAPHLEIAGGNMWQNRDLFTDRVPTPNFATFVTSVTDETIERGLETVYVTGQTDTGTKLFRYQLPSVLDPSQDTWEWVGTSNSGFAVNQGAGAYDPVRKIFLRTGGAVAPLAYFDLRTPGPANNEILISTLIDPTGQFLMNGNYGLDFDQARNVFVAWGGGGDVWEITPPVTLSAIGWTVARRSPTAGLVPDVDVGTGVLGKFKYIPNLRVFMALQHFSQGNIWIYKPLGWSPPTADNESPQVTLTAPANNSTLASGTVLSLRATAFDPDGTIQSVEFYRNGALIGSAASPPYSVNDTAPTAGSYSYTARAYDNSGNAAISTGANVIVTAPTSGTVVLQNSPGAYARTEDTFLDVFNAASAYGGISAQLFNNLPQYYGTMIRFAIYQSEGGPVPDGAMITSATLSLYKTSFNDHVYTLNRVLRDWTEGQATWNAAKPGVPWSVAGANGIGTDYSAGADAQASIGNNPGWIDFNMTGAVQTLGQTGNNYGWRLVPVSGASGSITFAAHEHDTSALHPKLIITYQGGGANQPPTVSLTSPTANALFAAPASIPLAVNAQDTDGVVSSVEFYRNGALIATRVSPASFTYADSNLGVGTYSYTAKAFDNLGAATTSSPIAITVGAANLPPTVNLTSPTANAQFTAPANITVTANAQDLDGTVASVEFYRNGILIATRVAPSSFTITDSALGAGTYSYTAKAFDNVNAATTSSLVTVTVAAAGSGTVTLQNAAGGYAGTQDTYIETFNPYSAAGGSNTQVFSNLSQYYGTMIRFAIYQSEGGPVPNGATITSATLSMYKTSFNDHVYTLNRMLRDWTESQASWNVARTGVAWSVVGANGIGTDYAATADAQASASYNPGWIDFNVTAAVQTLGQAGNNYGWRVVPVSGTPGSRVFAAHEYGTQTLRPKLVINYQSSGVVNQPPTVSLTSPTANAQFTAPASITVTANAQDSDGTVSSVEFYRNGTLIATRVAPAPFMYTDSAVGVGPYSYTAKAFDNLGAAITSSPIAVTVGAANLPPTVNLTSPTANAQFTAPANITVTANAQDSDGAVASVEFYRNGILIATRVAPASFMYTDSAVGVGAYSYTAKAFDNLGAAITSSPVAVTVNAPIGGTVTLQSAAGGYAGTQDTYIETFNPYSAAGGSSTQVFSNLSQYYGTMIRFAIYQSEGGPVPDGATITSATLSMYKTSFNDHVYTLNRMLRDWTESQASWNVARTGVAWSVVGANGIGTDYAATADAQASASYNPGWIDFNVTAAVQTLGQAGNNYGWRVVPVSGTSGSRVFAAHEYGTQALRPKLVISYTN